MKKLLLTLAVLGLIALSCNKNESVDINNPNADDPESIIPSSAERVDYELISTGSSNVTGLASLIRNEDGTSTMYIKLENASEGLHPATVNLGDTGSGGGVAITLERCECEISETVISQLDNGNPISFDELMLFDGHLNIYESPSDGTIIAEANIGSNAF